MANSSPILTYVLIGGAAYLAYQWWISQPVAAANTTTSGSGTPPPATTPPPASVVYVPPTRAQQLQTAAGAGVTTLNADQWAYYWNQLGFPAVDGGAWNTAFFPSGRPPAGSPEPAMTASAYMTALGLSGYKHGMGAIMIPVPLVRGRGFGNHYTLGDLRRAGGR
jgi:hypothetical protein